MISSLAWIPRGAAKTEPEFAYIPEEDAEALRAAADADAAAASDVSNLSPCDDLSHMRSNPISDNFAFSYCQKVGWMIERTFINHAE
jgi:hypothetical protein